VFIRVLKLALEGVMVVKSARCNSTPDKAASCDVNGGGCGYSGTLQACLVECNFFFLVPRQLNIKVAKSCHH
jgi:hypothetical protein